MHWKGKGKEMSSIEILLPVLIIWAVAVITPGPNFFITMHTAVTKSRQMSLYTVSGIVFGTVLWSVFGFFGISFIFKMIPPLYFVIKITGGLYLIWLGFNLLRPKKDRGSKPEIISHNPFKCFKTGLLTVILNPKTAAFMASLFAASIPANASYNFGVISIIAICSISAFWYSFVAVIFSHYTVKRLYDKFETALKKSAGVIFVFFGTKLALSD